MDPVVLSSLIGGAASLAGTGASMLATGNLNKKNREWNEQQAEINRQFQSEEADKARAWNMDATKELMNLENEYNSAEAQYKRLLETGMNPATALGMISSNGNAMASGSVQGNPGPSGSMPTGADMYGQGSMSGILAQGSNTIASLLANMPMKQAEYNLKVEELVGHKIENIMKKFDMEHQEAQWNKEFEIMEQTLEEKKAQVEGEQLQNELKKYDLKKADLDLSIKINELAMSNMDAAAHKEFLDLDLEIKAAEALYARTNAENQKLVIMTQIQEAKARMCSLYANAALAGAQKEGIDLENMVRDFNVKHQDDRYGREVAEYEKRMRKYNTDNTMSIINGAIGAVGEIGSLVWKFSPAGAIGKAIGSLGSGNIGTASYKISGADNGYYGGTEWNVNGGY